MAKRDWFDGLRLAFDAASDFASEGAFLLSICRVSTQFGIVNLHEIRCLLSAHKNTFSALPNRHFQGL